MIFGRWAPPHFVASTPGQAPAPAGLLLKRISWAETYRAGSDLPHLVRRTTVQGIAPPAAASAWAVQPLLPPAAAGFCFPPDPHGIGCCRSCSSSGQQDPPAATRVAYAGVGVSALPLCSECLTLAYTAAARPRLVGPIPDRLLTSLPRELLPRSVYLRRESVSALTERIQTAGQDPREVAAARSRRGRARQGSRRGRSRRGARTAGTPAPPPVGPANHKPELPLRLRRRDRASVSRPMPPWPGTSLQLPPASADRGPTGTGTPLARHDGGPKPNPSRPMRR